MKQIVICGGHLTPALALIDELQKEKEIKILFFGRKYATEGSTNLSAEYKIIKSKKIKFYVITAGRLQRKFTRHTITALLKTPLGFFQSLIYLLANRPKVILSFGGYLSLPVVFCGWLLGIKSVTHEQSFVPGLANVLNAYFVDRIFLTWPQTHEYFKNKKTTTIGNPTRKAIYSKVAKNKKLTKFICRKGKFIFVMGGNQGSHFLNNLIFELIGKLTNTNIIHQVGTANFKGDFDRAREIKKKNYFASDYIDPDNIGAVLNRADIIISRSGANSIWDLAILAKPSILLPLPFSAGNEQEANAKIMAEKNIASVLDQSEVDISKLNEVITYTFNNLTTIQKKALSFSKTLPRDAAKKLLASVLSYT